MSAVHDVRHYCDLCQEQINGGWTQVAKVSLGNAIGYEYEACPRCLLTLQKCVGEIRSSHGAMTVIDRAISVLNRHPVLAKVIAYCAA